MANSELKQVSLADIASSFASSNSNFEYFHGKLYSFIPPEPEKFASLAAALRLKSEMFPNSHPAILVVGKLGGLVPFQATQVLAVEAGCLRVLMQVADLQLPDCEYLAIISPVQRSGGETSYKLGLESIDFLRGLISLPFGKLPFYTWIAEFDFDLTGRLALATEAVRMPLFGDLFKIVDVGLLSEIVDRLSVQQADYRQRLQRAVKFFCAALNQNDEAFRFASYWIALEILVGGKSDAIRAKLAAAYEFPNKKLVDDDLLFREIEGIRHGLIHKGGFGVLASYQERIMQLYFWDIVIHQIGLRSRRLARMLVLSGLIEQERGANG